MERSSSASDSTNCASEASTSPSGELCDEVGGSKARSQRLDARFRRLQEPIVKRPSTSRGMRYRASRAATKEPDSSEHHASGASNW